jgi:hypothetical protein
MKVGSAISALKKSWAAYKIARQTGSEERCLELECRINSIQQALGLEQISLRSGHLPMANKVLPKHLQERKDQQYMYVDVREADELEELSIFHLDS